MAEFAVVLSCIPPTLEMGLGVTKSVQIDFERHFDTSHQGDPPSDVRMRLFSSVPDGVTYFFDPEVTFKGSRLFLTTNNAVAAGVYRLLVGGTAVSSSYQKVRSAELMLSV